MDIKEASKISCIVSEINRLKGIVDSLKEKWKVITLNKDGFGICKLTEDEKDVLINYFKDKLSKEEKSLQDL